ncbi:MAG: IclR family transcriptional regulator [Anaerolineae bacterium]|nr:IclR family transcriptional regulator [Anaerolineae bacterium]
MIQSVLKAIDLMNVFSPTEPYLSLSEIAARMDMPKSTAHNLLATLASRGFIEQLDNDSYALGTAIIPLTQAARVNAELRDRAAPLLREFADVGKESVYLTYLDGDFALYIYAIETSHRLMARTAVGDRVHLHCTGVGKAILAELPRQSVNDIISRVGLPSFTENTIVDAEVLFEELERIQKRGYSIDNQEHETGTYCIGVVIRDAHGKPIGGCSVSGRDPEIIGSREEDLVSDILYTAQEISRRMGYIPARPAQIVPRSNHVNHRDA